MRNHFAMTSLAALVSLTVLTGKGDASAIVVGHDIDTLSTYIAGANEARFATNVANLLTSNSSGKNLLLFESNAADVSRDFSHVVLNALTTAGFSVTVTTNYATSFSGFNAVFAAMSYPSLTFLNNNSLINYVAGGGGVYLAGGVGFTPIEAAGWNTFLNNYGLAFSTTNNGFVNVPITSANPIFSGVTSLNCGNGTNILDLGTNPNAQIVQTYQGANVYAVVNVPTSVPEPGTLDFLVIAGLLLAGAFRVRRRRDGHSIRHVPCMPNHVLFR